jgi:hypothetical protein
MRIKVKLVPDIAVSADGGSNGLVTAVLARILGQNARE